MKLKTIQSRISRGLLLLIATLFAFTSVQGIFTSRTFAHVASSKNTHGDFDVLINVDNKRFGLAGIRVEAQHPVVACSHNGQVQTTNSDGVASFRQCGVSNTGSTSAKYTISVSNTPQGYALNDSSSKELNVETTSRKSITFNYKTLVNTQPQQPSDPGPTPISDNDKNGKIQFTSYIREPNGSLTRQGGLNVRTNATGFDPGAKSADGKTLLNCDDYNKTTNEDKSNPTLYAQAHFTGCWTGSGGSKQYSIYYASLPANYQFRSLHITSGTFVDGSTSTTDSKLPVSFNVTKGNEVDLQFWIEKVVIPTDATGTPQGGTAPSGTTPGSTTTPATNKPGAPAIVGAPTGVVVRQVIGQRDTFFVAVRGGEPATTLATALTQSMSLTRATPPAPAECDPDEHPECQDKCDPDPVPGCPDYVAPDLTPPPSPKNFKIKTSDSGRPELSWDQVEGDLVKDENGNTQKDDNGKDVREEITYKITRITGGDPQNTAELIAELDSTDLSFTDDDMSINLPATPAKLPGSYTYFLYAMDEEDPPNESSPTVQEATLVIPPPQVLAEEDESSPTTSQPGSSDPNTPAPPSVQVANYSGDTRVSVPMGAGGAQPLACAVVNRDSVGSDLVNSIGEAQTTNSGLSCTAPDGEEVEEFDQEVEMDIDIENTLVSDDTELYGYDGTDWQMIETDGDGSTGEGTTLGYTKAGKVKGDKTTYKVRSKKPLTLAIIDKRNHSPFIKFVAISAMMLSVAGITFISYVIVVRRRMHERALHPYADVDITPLNPRADYTPTITAPKADDYNDRGAIAIRALEIVTILIVAFVLTASFQLHASASTKSVEVTKVTCEEQVTLLNSRAAILNQYKKTEEGKYKQLRNNWAKRVAYSGQWVPKESEKARDAIYKLDYLHQAHMKEVSNQIDEFIPLESDPLDCSDAKKDLVKQKNELANGTKKDNKLSGFLLTRKLSLAEHDYTKKEFSKTTDKMVNKLHGAKEKHPKAKKPTTTVKDPQ